MHVRLPAVALQIKRQQQEQLQKLKENPIQMMELLKNLERVRASKQPSAHDVA